MKVAFRTDASLDIGTGHVMRCLTLARALREVGADCHFITRDLEGHRVKYIEQGGFEVSLLPRPCERVFEDKPAHAFWAGVSWEQDAEETRAVLAIHSPDWLVVDHYAFDARWEKSARPDGCRLLVIDDLADRPHDCDLLIDQNLGRDVTDYAGLVPEHCECLVGPQFALLRPEFAKMRAQSLAGRAGRGLRHLLITMGGVDKDDATSAVLGALRSSVLSEELRITVIMGSHAPALERVRRLAKDMPWPTEVAVDVKDMAARMASADLAIGAAGSTTWERCCLGLPSIVVEIAPNQARIARAVSEAGAALVLGSPRALDFKNHLRCALTEVADINRLAELSKKSASICSGRGLDRLLSSISLWQPI